MQTVFGGFVIGLGLAMSVVAVRPSPDNPPTTAVDEKKGTESLEGTYTIVSGKENGKAIPAERIKGSVVKFTGNTVLGTDKDKKEFFSATYTLDTSKTSWVISMTSKQPKEARTTGLVKKDGETLTIIYALPGGKAPKDFTTEEMQQMFVLKPAGKIGKEPVRP
jgi:uncharacterized protein (TIGR03067 family)